METTKFTVICHGKRRESLTGNATISLFPSLQPLTRIEGAVDHLSGEVSTSQSNKFPLVNFIDTPGLIDGQRYTFDIDLTLDIIAAMADLVLVFFDPQGQALCQRTLAHLERLCMTQPKKLSVWLTKCDLIEEEVDRMKVLQQITSELSRRHQIARQNLYLKPIFIPGLSKYQPTVLNQLSTLTQLIEKALTAHLQDNVLLKLISHCDYLTQTIGEKRLAEQCHVETCLVVSSSCAAIPIVFMSVTIAFIILFLGSRETITLTGGYRNELIIRLWDQLHSIPESFKVPLLCGAFACVAVCGFCASRHPVPSSAMTKKLNEGLQKLDVAASHIEEVRKEANDLYAEYLKRTIDL